MFLECLTAVVLPVGVVLPAKSRLGAGGDSDPARKGQTSCITDLTGLTDR